MSGRVVYFVQNAEGHVKIGWTADLTRRLQNLQMAASQPLAVLVVTAGGPTLEAHLHDRFAAERLQGEWFKPSEDLLSLAARLRSGEAGIFPAGFAEPDSEGVLAAVAPQTSKAIARHLIRKLGPRDQNRQVWSRAVARLVGVSPARAYELSLTDRVRTVSADELRAIRLAVRMQGAADDLQEEMVELIAELDDVVTRLERARALAGRVRGLAASNGLNVASARPD